jgi:hypothetical protein
MRGFALLISSAILLSGVNIPCLAQNADRANEIKSSIVTLYARDPLAQSFCFKDGGYGGAFSDGKATNRCSDLNFNSYYQNNFSVGVEGGRQGNIIDLGTPEELQKRYGYEETVGKGQGFASIRVRNGKAMILKDYRAQTWQEISESNLLFQKPEKSLAATPTKLGHVYLLRITDRYNKDFELLAKILVIAYLPDESVTLRWQILSNEIKQEN